MTPPSRPQSFDFVFDKPSRSLTPLPVLFFRHSSNSSVQIFGSIFFFSSASFQVHPSETTLRTTVSVLHRRDGPVVSSVNQACRCNVLLTIPVPSSVFLAWEWTETSRKQPKPTGPESCPRVTFSPRASVFVLRIGRSRKRRVSMLFPAMTSPTMTTSSTISNSSV